LTSTLVLGWTMKQQSSVKIWLFFMVAMMPFNPVLAATNSNSNDPQPTTSHCSQSDGEEQNDSTKQECPEPKSSDAKKAAKEGDKTALESVEKKIEEERLKVLFVDVNTVVETLGSTMDWTANWLDGYFADDEAGKDKAKAWGHVVIGWEPIDGEWINFPVKFKVRAKLPNLKNKVEIILSDNEQEDFKTLPYETVRPDAYKSSQRSLGAAVRFLHSTSENVKTSSRLGWGDGQAYARSQLSYRKKFFEKKVTLNMQPAIEYYFSDGWGARFLVDTGYEINQSHEVRLNYSLQERESFDAPEWRTGVYSISALSEKSALIVGASSVGVVEPDYTPEFHKFSVRFRRKAIRSWIFLEVEPFVQFTRELLTDEFGPTDIYSDFERDVGITFRFEAHYGFL